ncbi:lipoprotein [Streptomyces sp. MMG1121]|nr:lipoprotein [Streptomyces sp. MMG1121]
MLLASTGCGGPSGADSAKADVQHLLDRRSTALLGHDETTYAVTGTRTDYTRLRALPLASWTYRVTAVRDTAAGATADADLSYRVAGYDTAPVDARRTLTLGRTADGKWYVSADRPAEEAGQQLWDQGPVTVVQGAHSLVLGTGRTTGELRAYAGLADRAVPAVSRAWGTDWSRRVVVLVPRSLDDMAGLLGSPAANYRGIAAVTTGEVGGSGQAPADRVVVNPDAYAALGDLGKQVVLTHETTHVATRAHTTAATPLWLSEGYADWIGYLGTGRTPTEAAPELTRSVQDGRAPAALPADKDFGFTSDPTKLAQAYESGWLACRMIADQWGTARLGAFYRAVGAHAQRAGAVEDALKKTLGTTQEAFTAQWQAYVRAQLG